MAKKNRTLNPAEAFRKAQRQKEIKRNKLDRKKARESDHSKKDSSVIQAEINQLERLSKRTPSEENRLNELKNEILLIFKAKEQKGLASSSLIGIHSSSKVIIDPATGLPAVPSSDSRHGTEQNAHHLNSSRSSNLASNSRSMNWFGPDGKLLEPEKSFYYDPVFNPFGVPPPGMPVRMKDNLDLPSRTLTSDFDNSTTANEVIKVNDTQDSASQLSEVDAIPDKQENQIMSSDENQSEEDSIDNDEDDIPLPEGSPPRNNSDDDTDDDIPLPEGPPPPKLVQKLPPKQLINRPQQHPNQASLSHPGFTHSQSFFPPPISLVPGIPPPPIIGGLGAIPFPLGPNGLLLPPPPLNKFHPLPPPPPSANLPAKPDITKTIPNSTVDVTSKPIIQASATMSALPQLRDLKREATSFVPAAIRKKRKELDRRAGLAGLGDSNRIQAAPGAFHDSNDNQDSLHSESQDPSDSKYNKQIPTSLLATLKRDGVVSDAPISKSHIGAVTAEKDDYDKFVESLGDVL